MPANVCPRLCVRLHVHVHMHVAERKRRRMKQVVAVHCLCVIVVPACSLATWSTCSLTVQLLWLIVVFFWEEKEKMKPEIVFDHGLMCFLFFYFFIFYVEGLRSEAHGTWCSTDSSSRTCKFYRPSHTPAPPWTTCSAFLTSCIQWAAFPWKHIITLTFPGNQSACRSRSDYCCRHRRWFARKLSDFAFEL